MDGSLYSRSFKRITEDKSNNEEFNYKLLRELQYMHLENPGKSKKWLKNLLRVKWRSATIRATTHVPSFRSMIHFFQRRNSSAVPSLFSCSLIPLIGSTNMLVSSNYILFELLSRKRR